MSTAPARASFSPDAVAWAPVVENKIAHTEIADQIVRQESNKIPRLSGSGIDCLPTVFIGEVLGRSD